MTVNKRLLFGSLIVAAVLSVVIGYAISDRGSGGEGSGASADAPIVLDTNHQLDQTLNTNAAVRGTQLPRVTVQTQGGDDRSTADLLGRPLVVNIWYSGCLPCKKELPDFVKVHDELGDKVRFVGLDSLAPSATEEQFAKDHGVDYELLYDTNGTFLSAAGVSSQPQTFFVRADGTIVAQYGQIDADTLRSVINSELL